VESENVKINDLKSAYPKALIKKIQQKYDDIKSKQEEDDAESQQENNDETQENELHIDEEDNEETPFLRAPSKRVQMNHP
jgi:hypothetical protein